MTLESIDRATISLSQCLGRITYADLRASLCEVGDILDDQTLWLLDHSFEAGQQVDWHALKAFMAQEGKDFLAP